MIAAYDSYNYPKYWEDRNYEHNVEVLAIKNFLLLIKQKGSIIDIGCGHGRLSCEYIDDFEKVTLADPSGKLLQIAKQNCDDKKINFIKSSVETIADKVRLESYDVALFVRVLHHIDDPDSAFKIINKVLKRKGYLIVEFANKVHGKALLKHFCSGDFTFPLNILPNDRRSKKNKKNNSISFLNHHPDKIEESLINNGFKIIERRSVSNVRNDWLKRHAPQSVLILIEKWLQKPLARINFGPSIFILAEKK